MDVRGLMRRSAPVRYACYSMRIRRAWSRSVSTSQGLRRGSITILRPVHAVMHGIQRGGPTRRERDITH